MWTCEQLAGLELGLSFLVDFRDRRPAAAPTGQEALSKSTTPLHVAHLTSAFIGEELTQAL